MYKTYLALTAGLVFRPTNTVYQAVVEDPTLKGAMKFAPVGPNSTTMFESLVANPHVRWHVPAGFLGLAYMRHIMVWPRGGHTWQLGGLVGYRCGFAASGLGGNGALGRARGWRLAGGFGTRFARVWVVWVCLLRSCRDREEPRGELWVESLLLFLLGEGMATRGLPLLDPCLR